MSLRRYPWHVIIKLASESLVDLAYARLILHHTRPKDILHRNVAMQRRAASLQPQRADHAIRAAGDEVAFIILRLARRLPWRTDCLVQAIAGQRMLTRRGLVSEIVVGTAKHADGTFEAHAWLSCAGTIILGGDIARFKPLLEPRAGSRRRP